MRPAHLVPVALAMLFTACNDVTSSSADLAAVEATTAVFHEALRKNDLERFMSYVADDVVFMPMGESAVRGKDAMRTWMTGFLAQYRTTSLNLANREVIVGEGWAVESGTYEWQLTPAAGGPPQTDRGNYMQVWRRQKDKTWRFAREVYNSSVPVAPAQGAATPALPFEDLGACPFEGCAYREWTARADIQVRTDRRQDAPVAFRLHAGEPVTALTGIVVTVRAGRVQFDAPVQLMSAEGPFEVQPSQPVYLLTYQGEGFSKVWFDGRVYTSVDITGVMNKNPACASVPSRCRGRIIEPSRTEWWVQVRNGDGQVGWTHEPDKFDGKDSRG